MSISLSHFTQLIKGEIQLTSSKSESNRALIIRALCGKNFEMENLATAEDTVILKKTLHSILHLSTTNNVLDVGLAGTAMRFLTAYLAIQNGEWTLTGSSRMKERPIRLLVTALHQMGAEIEYIEKEGFPPLKIKGKELIGGKIQVDGSVSSQYISALLLIAPQLKKGLQLDFIGELTSKPYIEMTINMMCYFGVSAAWKNNSITVNNGNYKAKDFIVEADWSSASYWYSMVALAKEAKITLLGLKLNSLQGDAVVAKIYENFGVKTEYLNNGVRLTKTSDFGLRTSDFRLNFSNCPDLAQAVAVTCAALNVPAKLTGLSTLRIKETDRILALQTELCKLGYNVEVEGDDLIILSSLRTEQRGVKQSVSNNKIASCLAMTNTIKTYNDHRMAMAFAPLALLYPITIENPDVVIKSYPNFWKDLERVGFVIE
ncbi:MAG: 3-phosphoshikimate 1-carboxyvinyltransferase [Flavobacteriales bacterium CG_4_9_14_3_um_filter_32_8]|nr:MAG: 3-phosphoshikimate 1-carboxyvinyltransferase [Flavobacteriales bacterium CG_4_9_14_3_um_filter_32_8]